MVAHHANIAKNSTQHFDDFILNRIGILVLVYQNEMKTVLVLVQNFRVGIEQPPSFVQQVIEIHCTRFEQPFLVFHKQLRESFPAGEQFFFNKIGVIGQILWTNQLVF